MEQIAVSVIVPVYQAQAHLRLCLDSLLAQTCRELEILCVDDGSTDQSAKILGEFARQDSRVKVLRQKNAGPGAARNAGLEAAAGEFVLFLDADDFFEPALIETLLTRARDTGADIVICRAEAFNSQTGETQPWMRQDDLLPGDCFSPLAASDVLFQFGHGQAWDKLYRRDFLLKTGLTFPALPNSEDLVFVFQSLALADRIALTDQVLVHYRTGNQDSVLHARTRHLDAPYQAAALLRDGLLERGLYDTYRHSYVNWAVSFLTWHVARLQNRQSQRLCLAQLKSDWLDRLDLRGLSVRDFDSRMLYGKYLLAAHAPYPVFAGVTRAYYAWKGRMDT